MAKSDNALRVVSESRVETRTMLRRHVLVLPTNDASELLDVLSDLIVGHVRGTAKTLQNSRTVSPKDEDQ